MIRMQQVVPLSSLPSVTAIPLTQAVRPPFLVVEKFGYSSTKMLRHMRAFDPGPTSRPSFGHSRCTCVSFPCRIA